MKVPPRSGLRQLLRCRSVGQSVVARVLQLLKTGRVAAACAAATISLGRRPPGLHRLQASGSAQRSRVVFGRRRI